MESLIFLLSIGGVGLVLILFGWLWMRGGNIVRKLERQIDAEGTDAEAAVIAHRTRTARHGATYHYITFEYTVKLPNGQDRKITLERAISGGDYDRFPPGDRVPIRYLPDTPDAVNLRGGIRETYAGRTFQAGGIFVLVIGAILVAVGVGYFLSHNTLGNYALPGTPATGRLLVPLSVDGGKMQLFRFDVDGLRRVNITGTQTDEENPKWSPDGKHIAFESMRDGNDHIYVMDADGSNPRNLSGQTTRTDTDPAWSPDGTRILFSTSIYDTQANTTLDEIWVMNADGSNQKNLSSDHTRSDNLAAWAPDGKQIAFTGAGKDSSAVWIMGGDGSQPMPLTDPTNKDGSPVWSLDGQSIAFIRGYSPKQALWLMNADGSNARQIGPVGQYYGKPAWSPDGQSIAYVAALPGYDQLYIVTVNGASNHLAAPAQAADSDFAWSPDGKQMVVVSNLESPTLGVLMLIDVAARTRTTIVDDVYCGRAPVWLPGPVKSSQ